jgi:hypothetical protein
MKKIILAVIMVLLFAMPVMADAPVNVWVNNKMLDTPGLLIDGKTYVPLRAVSEGLGAQVDWDGSQAIVTSVKRPVITGDSVSASKVNEALDLLKSKTPADYEMVCRYTRWIRISPTNIDSPYGEAYAITLGPDSYELSPRLLQDKDIKCVASALVHESVHLCDKFYNANVDRIITENNAYLHEITVLRILGASQGDIDGVEQDLIRATK